MRREVLSLNHGAFDDGVESIDACVLMFRNRHPLHFRHR